MNYFIDCNTLDEAKKVYRKYLMILHPDKPNGSHTKTVDLINQFKAFKPTKVDKTDVNFDFDKFHNLVMKFENLDGLTVSFVGTWIWIEGETRPQKDKIKAIVIDGYTSARWHKVKKVWFFAPSDTKKRKGNNKTLSEIKSLYGSQSFETKKRKLLS